MHKVISQKTSRSRSLIRPSSLVISVPKKTMMFLAVEKGNARASNSKKVSYAKKEAKQSPFLPTFSCKVKKVAALLE